MANPALAHEVTSYLSTKHLSPTPAWVSSFLPTIRSNTPLPALQKTALFRLLATDITQTLSRSPTSCFPPTIHDDSIKERKLPGPFAVQVLDIEDIGRSRWSQIEAIEAAERGETTKGHEIIRTVPTDEQDTAVGGEGVQVVGAGAGPHKLLLQDAQGTCVYGVELQTIEGVGMGMSIGSKLALRDVVVARGCLLLNPGCVTLLGGKIEGVDKAWKEGLKGRLKSAAGIAEDG
jgi:RecQ-mediated genome instability protein 1